MMMMSRHSIINCPMSTYLCNEAASTPSFDHASADKAELVKSHLTESPAALREAVVAEP